MTPKNEEHLQLTCGNDPLEDCFLTLALAAIGVVSILANPSIRPPFPPSTTILGALDDRCGLCRALDSPCDYPEFAARHASADPSDVPLEDETLEAIMRILTDEQSATHKSGPPIHGTEARATILIQIPSADECHGPDANLVNTLAQLVSLSTVPQNPEASCPQSLCLWHDEGAPSICGDVISCKTVPEHYKSVHGIRGINTSVWVGCRWRGCVSGGVRNNFARHIREIHLGHARDKGHSS